MPVIRIIEGPGVNLPHNWQGFQSQPNDETELATLLSYELVGNALKNKVVVTAGGSLQCDIVLCTKPLLTWKR